MLPRIVRFFVVVPAALVFAGVTVWVTKGCGPDRSDELTPRVAVETATVAGVTFEVEHRPGSDECRAVWGADAATVFRDPDRLDFKDDIVAVGGLGFPSPKPGDVVRWNLSGPLLLNGQPQSPHRFQPRQLDPPGTDLRWTVRGGSDAPRDSLGVDWSRAGRVLVSANGDGCVRVWNPDRAEVRTVLEPDPVTDGRRRWGLVAAVSPDGKTVATANVQADGVTLWDADSGTRLADLPEPTGKVAYLRFRDNQQLLEARGDTLVLRDLTGDRSKTVALGKVHSEIVPPFALSADGTTLAQNDGHTVTVSRMAPGGGAVTLATIDKVTDEACFAVSPDGSVLAVFDGKGRLALHDAKTGAVRQRLWWRVKDDDPYHIGAMAFAPDGKTLVVGGAKQLRLFDVETGRERAWMECSWVRSLAYSADGRTLAASLRYGAGVRVWDTADLVAK